MPYPNSPPSTENKVQYAAMRYQRLGRLKHRGKSNTSGGIGKNDDSANESAMRAPRAEGRSAHESVQS